MTTVMRKMSTSFRFRSQSLSSPMLRITQHEVTDDCINAPAKVFTLFEVARWQNGIFSQLSLWGSGQFWITWTKLLHSALGILHSSHYKRAVSNGTLSMLMAEGTAQDEFTLLCLLHALGKEWLPGCSVSQWIFSCVKPWCDFGFW